MPELLKVSIKGSLPNGEVWSVNPVFSTPTEPTLSFDQMNTILTAINGLSVPVGLAAWLSPVTYITGARIEQRERNGVLVGQAEQNRATPYAGAGTARLPVQTSTVFSLASSFPGARGRGRLYWPMTSGGLGVSDHRISSTDCNALVSGMKTYLSGIEAANTATTTAADLVVWSRTSTAYHQVVKLRVGNVPDTQRRRRDKLVETYVSVDFV